MPTRSICEEETYNNIYRNEAEKLRNHLYYKCGDFAVAEDFVQEVFLKLWNKCKDVVLETVVGFLYTASNRMFIDKIRSEKVSLKFEKKQLPQINSEDPYFQLRTEEFREKIETAISNLPDGQREAFLLNRIDKLTYKEIAVKLEISTTAVENRMSKALVRLKNTIEELHDFNF